MSNSSELIELILTPFYELLGLCRCGVSVRIS